jgi:Ca2+/H+ antiporter
LLLLGMLLLRLLLLSMLLFLLLLLVLVLLLLLLFGLGLLFLLRVARSNASEEHERQKCCADNSQSLHKPASDLSLSLATFIDCLVLTTSEKDDHAAVAEVWHNW